MCIVFPFFFLEINTNVCLYAHTPLLSPKTLSDFSVIYIDFLKDLRQSALKISFLKSESIMERHILTHTVL